MIKKLTQDLKQKVIDLGFVSVGITHPDMLRDLPHGWVGELIELHSPKEELPSVQSVMVMAFQIWDKTFFLNTVSPINPTEEYFFSYEVMKNKAWNIVSLLQNRGFEALWSVRIPLKPTAVQCGIGCQGKNTLLITPTHGPRINLIAILTNAELEIDQPYVNNLCGDCDKCLMACPTKALDPYRCNITRCMVYSLECPSSPDVPDDVKTLEKRLTQRPTKHSYIECSTCMQVCPIGKPPTIQ